MAMQYFAGCLIGGIFGLAMRYLADCLIGGIFGLYLCVLFSR